MANPFEDPQEAVLKMTRAQIEKALELAAAADYDKKTDPAFVVAIVMALAINSQTAGLLQARLH